MRLARRREVVVLVPCAVHLVEADLRAVVQELGVPYAPGQSWQMEVFQGPGRQMQIQTGARLCVQGVGRGLEGARPGTVHGPGVQLGPLADGAERVPGPGVQGAATGGSDVQDEVSAAGDGLHQHADQQRGVLVVVVVAVVPPRAVEGVARLPHHPLAVPLQRPVGLVLLGRHIVARNSEPVIDHNARLQLSCEVEKLPRAPLLRTLLRVGEVEEEQVDPAVFGEEFAYLPLHVLPVARHVAGLPPGLGVPQRVVLVDREVGVVPVEQRVVQADPQTLGAHRVDELAHQVTAGRVHRGVFGQGRSEQAETVVVFGGQHRVTHPGLPRGSGQLTGVEEVGIEPVQVTVVLLLRHGLPAAHPLVPRRQAVQAEVDEEPEARRLEPPGADGGISGNGGSIGHGRLLTH